MGASIGSDVVNRLQPIPHDREWTVDIMRFDPAKGPKPKMQRYTIKRADFRGIMLLDLLEALKVQDPSLAFRRSCGGGVCGSDGMNINGKNGLACITPLGTLPTHVTLRPLPGFEIIRDLIVDMQGFFKQFESVKPFLQTKQTSDKEFLQTEQQRAALDGLYECILCACCTSSCPSFWWNPDRFVGPAGLLWACRFISDSRDDATEERLHDLEGLYRLYRCRSIMNCVDACPRGLNPSKAIAHIRQKMLNDVPVTKRG